MKKKTIYLFVFLFVACAPQETRWKDVTSKNAIASYEEYLKEYPTGKYVSNAKDSIKKMTWEKTKSDNSLTGYLNYLKSYPNDEHALIADSLLWLSVKKNDSDSAYRSYLDVLKQPIHKQEGNDALSKNVLFPHIGFIGDMSDMPPKEELILSDDFISKNSEMDYLDFQINGSASSFIYNGKIIELANNALNGKILKTTKFGELKFIVEHGGLSSNGRFVMYIYLFGTRAQRDALANLGVK